MLAKINVGTPVGLQEISPDALLQEGFSRLHDDKLAAQPSCASSRTGDNRTMELFGVLSSV